MMDFGVARDKLAWMESADEIADFLGSQGVVACPMVSDRCAIAVWMQRETGLDVHVSQYVMWDEDTRREDGYFGVEADHTDAIKQFTVRFDHRAYPHLVDPNWVDPGHRCNCPACYIG